MLFSINDIVWSEVKEISDINEEECSCSIHYSDGEIAQAQIPRLLFFALIKKGEQNYIDQDIERSEWEPGKPD